MREQFPITSLGTLSRADREVPKSQGNSTSTNRFTFSELDSEPPDAKIEASRIRQGGIENSVLSCPSNAHYATCAANEFVSEMTQLKSLFEINSTLPDPSILMVRSDHRPMLEKIIQGHVQQGDKKSITLKDRAKKMKELIDSLQGVSERLQNRYQAGMQREQARENIGAYQISKQNQTASSKQPKGVSTPTHHKKSNTNTRTEKNVRFDCGFSTDAKPINLEEQRFIEEIMESGLPHFNNCDEKHSLDNIKPSRTSSEDFVNESRSSKASRLSFSRVLDIHQVLKNSHASRHSSDMENEKSIELIEKEINEINQGLQQLRANQRLTNEKITDMRKERLSEQLELIKATPVHPSAALPKQHEPVKTIHIEIKKPSKPMVLRTSRNAIVLELQRDREEQPPPIRKHNCSESSEHQSKRSVSSIKSSRVIKITSNSRVRPQPTQRPRYEIAKKKPLLSTRVANSSRPS